MQLTSSKWPRGRFFERAKWNYYLDKDRLQIAEFLEKLTGRFEVVEAMEDPEYTALIEAKFKGFLPGEWVSIMCRDGIYCASPWDEKYAATKASDLKELFEQLAKY